MTIIELAAYLDDLIKQGFADRRVFALGEDAALHEITADDVFISTELDYSERLIIDGTPL